MKIYGIERTLNLKEDNVELNSTKYQFIVIGLKALIQAESDSPMCNKDKVAVFTTSPESFRIAYEKGYRRVFKVSTLNRITSKTILASDKIKLKEVTEQYNFYLLKSLTLEFGDTLNSIDAMKELVVSLRSKNNIRLAEVLSTQGDKIIESAEIILRLGKLSQNMKDLNDLAIQLEDLQTRVTESSKSPSKEQAEESNEVSAEYSKIQQVLLQTQKDLQNAISEKKKVEATIADLARNSEAITASLEESKKKEQTQFNDFKLTIEEKNEEINKSAEELKRANSELDAEKTTLESVKGNLNEITLSYNSLVITHKELLTQIDKTQEVITTLQTENSGLKEAGANLTANEMISKLKEQLSEASKSAGTNDYLKNMMPVFGSSFITGASKFIVLKEIKTAVYMNTLLSSLNEACKSRINKGLGKSYIIIVLDTMLDEFRNFKYKSMGYGVNEQPRLVNAKSPNICVINRYDTDFLKNTLKVNDYNYVVVVDRLKLPRTSVDTVNCEYFYMIDSINDINTYSLKSTANLIVYGESQGTLQNTIYIKPEGSLFSANTDTRDIEMYRCNAAEKILKMSGIF